MKEKASMNVWKESFPIEIRFLTKNNDLGKVAGNWTWPETGPHTVCRFSEQPVDIFFPDVSGNDVFQSLTQVYLKKIFCKFYVPTGVEPMTSWLLVQKLYHWAAIRDLWKLGH